MRPEVVNGEVEAIFETTDDYEVLFAALDHARRVMKLRKRPAINGVSSHVRAAAPEMFDDESHPVLIEGEDLKLVEQCLKLYADTAFVNLGVASQAERHMQGHAFSLLDDLDAARAQVT